MSRGRQRVEFERLCAALLGARGVGDALVGEWIARLQALPGEEGAALATSLLRTYRHGALWPDRWTALVGRPPEVFAEIDDTLRRFWDAAAAAGLTRAHSIDGVGHNRQAIRRWAWQPRWYLMEQDEDLLLMDDVVVPMLLEIAGEPGVPKRDYMLEIAGHHARDTCSAALYWDRDLAKTLTRAAAWAPAARAVGASALAEYLERLGRHAQRGPVDREGAVQRLVDLARCQPPPPGKIEVAEVPGGWAGPLLFSSTSTRIRIDAATGVMGPVDGPPDASGRRKKKKR